MTDPSQWGYDLYPERKGNFKPSVSKILLTQEGNEPIDKFKCETNIVNCLKKSKMVQLMVGALKASGCEIDVARHITCEVCHGTVHGGFDPELNQIVVCQNTCRKEATVQGVLTHEMIHMFDYCNNKVDFKNVDHLACTEIRAANLTHCSLISSFMQGDLNLLYIKEQHQYCVKTKALQSILAVRKNVSVGDAMAAVDRVFPRCYADLEPIGRRMRAGSNDAKRAYSDGFLYGYT